MNISRVVSRPSILSLMLEMSHNIGVTSSGGVLRVTLLIGQGELIGELIRRVNINLLRSIKLKRFMRKIFRLRFFGNYPVTVFIRHIDGLIDIEQKPENAPAPSTPSGKIQPSEKRYK